jgi:hypothetical protein
MSDAVPGVGEGPAKVLSVSLPEGTVLALRELAGPRGVSALVDAAVEQYLRNRMTAAYLDEYQKEHGAFTADERRAAADVWAAAEQLAGREQGTWSEAGLRAALSFWTARDCLSTSSRTGPC